MAEKQAISTPSFIPYNAIKARYCHRIPSCLFRSGKLTPPELLLWVSLANFALFDGVCCPKIETLAEDTGLSIRSVNRHLASLIKKGFLRVVPRSKCKSSHRSNSYELLQHPVFDSVVKAQPNDDKLAQTECQSGTSTNANLAPKREKEKERKTTTTTRESCESPVEIAVSGNGGRGFSLSSEELHYIQLQVEFTAAHGDLRKPPRRLEKTLMRLAAAGKLDMSDFEDLKKWEAAQGATHSSAVLPRLPDKEALHVEVAAKNREALKWWNSLNPTHPAKCDVKPSRMPEDLWIRSQYQKYTQSEEMKNVA